MKKAGLGVLLLCLLVCVCGCGRANRNIADRDTALQVHDALLLYSGEKLGFSFLYPQGTDTAYVKEDGVYLYGSEQKGAPYVLIYRGNRPIISPELYFAGCNRMMLRSFDEVASTPIYSVTVGEKQLYLTRYACKQGQDELVIDRYLEPYDRFYIQYTAISETADAMNTPLYYAISTLKTQQGAYQGAWSRDTAMYMHGDADFQMNIPQMLDVTSLTIGYMGYTQDVVFMAIRCTQDHEGNAIYNRQDFIDRAAADPSFVSGFIGAGESMTFAKGEKQNIHGVTFYNYPAELQSGEELYNGALLLANAPDTGCYMLYYGVREGCVAHEATLQLMEECVKTFEQE